MVEHIFHLHKVVHWQHILSICKSNLRMEEMSNVLRACSVHCTYQFKVKNQELLGIFILPDQNEKLGDHISVLKWKVLQFVNSGSSSIRSRSWQCIKGGRWSFCSLCTSSTSTSTCTSTTSTCTSTRSSTTSTTSRQQILTVYKQYQMIFLKFVHEFLYVYEY